MNEQEKVIRGLECCAHEEIGDCDNCPYNENTPHCDIAMMRDAIALLKAQEPRIMTAEDMWTIKFNDTVIIEQNIPSLLIPAIVCDNIKHDDALEVLQVVTASTNGRIANADYEYYGKTWRCWTSRPTDEQREATPWN